MAKGSVYGPERAILRDARSGLRVIRLTHCATISTNLYIEMGSFTDDDAYVVLRSQRGAGRDAPWDLFRARTDGLELVQMTDADDVEGACVSPALGCVLYRRGAELRKIDLRSLEEAPVAEIGGLVPDTQGGLGSVDARGACYFGAGTKEDGGGVLFRADLATGEAATLYEGHRQGHVHVDPTGRTVSFSDYEDDGAVAYLIDASGGNLRPFPARGIAHCTWFGETGGMQGCLLPPGHALVTFSEQAPGPQVLAAGRYYWHSSPSPDAQWIVADTNWPQEGIYLLHVPTRTVTFVCDPRSTPSHPQWTHPHPSLSPGMRYVVFNSDLTGLGQAYLAELTDEFLDQAARGCACAPGPIA